MNARSIILASILFVSTLAGLVIPVGAMASHEGDTWSSQGGMWSDGGSRYGQTQDDYYRHQQEQANREVLRRNEETVNGYYNSPPETRQAPSSGSYLVYPPSGSPQLCTKTDYGVFCQ